MSEETIQPPSGFAVKTIFSFVAQGIIFATNFLIGVIVARLLGPEGKGNYALITSGLAILLPLVLLGMPFALPFFVGREKWHPNKTFILACIICFSFLFVVLSIFFFLPEKLLLKASLTPTVSYLFRIFIFFALPLRLISEIAIGILKGRELIIQAIWPLLAQTLAKVLFLVLFVFAIERSLNSVVAADLSSQALGALALFIILWHYLSTPWPSRRSPALRPLLSYGLQATASYFLFVLYSRVDLFLVNYFRASAAAGLYSVAMVFGEFSQAPSEAIFTVLFPRLNLLEPEQRKEWTLRVHRVVIIISLATASFLAALAFLIPQIYGRPFTGAVIPTFICLIGCITWALARTIAYFLFSENKILLYMLSTGIGIIIMVGLDLLLIPRLGITGAALGYTSSLWARYLLLLLFASRFAHLQSWKGFIITRDDLSVIYSSLAKIVRGFRPASSS